MEPPSANTTQMLLHDGGRFGRWADGLNPIFVAETRKLWKSGQFVYTFFLLLTAAWGLSAVAFFAPEVILQFVPFGYGHTGQISGAALFFVYYSCLVAAIYVVVPVRALESLAAEYDGNTLEMILLTRIPSDRITGGKMWCAILHMTIYFAAIVPFIAVTYLLQGIDLLTIFILLFLAFVGSVGLTCLALLLGSFCRSVAARPFTLILLLFFCVLSAYGWLSAVLGTLLFSGGFGVGELCGLLCCFIPWITVSTFCLGLAIRRVRPKPPRAGRIEFVGPDHLSHVGTAVLQLAASIREQFPVTQDEPPPNPPKQLPFREAHSHVLNTAIAIERMINRHRRPYEIVVQQTPLTPKAVHEQFSRLRKRYYEVVAFYHWFSICCENRRTVQWADRFQIPEITNERLLNLEQAARELIDACQSTNTPPAHHRPAESHEDIWEE